MTSNTLEFYSDVFAKDTKTFLQLISHITPHLAKRDLAIAKFLSFQTPENFWLVRKLNFEYDKIFSEKIELLKNFIEQIARASTLTIHEVGNIDYATKETDDLLNNAINNLIENEDIISITDNDTPEMDTLDEEEMDSSTNHIIPFTSQTTNTSIILQEQQ